MNSEIVEAKTSPSEVLNQVIMKGDLSKLSETEKMFYYSEVCKSLNLNPLTRPFDYLTLNGKLTLYARKDCTEQLRRLNNISIKILSKEVIDDAFVVTVEAITPDGRVDTDMGAVSIKGLTGDNKINAMLKAITKAKRRVTLSISGLGLPDESELETIPHAGLKPYDVDVNKAASPFKTATLRNKFQIDLTNDMKTAKNVAALNELIRLNKDKLDAMRASGDERDEMSVTSINNSYKLSLQDLKEEEPLRDELDERMEAFAEPPAMLKKGV